MDYFFNVLCIFRCWKIGMAHHGFMARHFAEDVHYLLTAFFSISSAAIVRIVNRNNRQRQSPLFQIREIVLLILAIERSHYVQRRIRKIKTGKRL